MTLCSPDAPCEPYGTIADFCGTCEELANTPENNALFLKMIDVATATVFRLTQSRYTGECSSLIRPCKKGGKCCLPFSNYNNNYNGVWGQNQFPSYVFSRGNTIYNQGCPTDCYDDCDCSGADCITLPFYPVCEIEEVKIDGVILDPSEYYLRDQKYLCRKNDLLWPTCQRLDKDLTETDTWSVKFKHGIEIPADLKHHTLDYACQLAKRCLGKPCDLPQRVTILEQQIILDPLMFVQQGLTGHGRLDSCIRSLNPTGALRPARLINPRKLRQSYSRVNP